jgi:hypothetical protein
MPGSRRRWSGARRWHRLQHPLGRPHERLFGFNPNGNPSPSHSFGDISRYANKPVSDAAISKQIELLVKCPSRSDVNDDGPSGSMWSLGWVGGNYMNSRERTETAYVHRNMSTLLRPTCAWPDDAAREGVDDAPGSVGGDLLAWTEEMIAAIAPETPHESYQNFPESTDQGLEAAVLRREPRPVNAG